MDKVFQVFVSSTFTDLEEERRLVSNSLAKAGYIAAGMELFPATDQDQFEFIKRIIDRSDYYVVITAGRYGSVASDGLSYTEKEFDYAKSKGIPILAFPHRNPGALAVDKWDADTSLRPNLDGFNGKLKAGRIVDSWLNKDDLCTKIVIALASATNLMPGTGWVRGDNAIDPKVLQETERLRIENKNLQDRLATYEGGGLVFDEALLGPTDTLEINATLQTEESNATESKVMKVTYGDIYEALYDFILEEPTEDSVEQKLIEIFSLSYEREGSVVVKYQNLEIKQLGHQFEALGLIRTVAQTHRSSHSSMSSEWTYIHWHVTDKGRRFVIGSRALKRS